MSCIINAPTTGGPSPLFDVLYNEIANKNESRARELYSYFMASSFKDSFGDWQKAYDRGTSDLSRTLDTGEPKLFRNEDGSFYYLDKDNNRVGYPTNTDSLLEVIDNDTLTEVVNYFALNYLVQEQGINMENIDMEDSKVTRSLEKYIKDEIERRTSEINKELEEFDYENGDYVKYANNESALMDFPKFINSISELKTLIKNKLRTINVSIGEDTELNNQTNNDVGEINVEEQVRDSGFGVVSMMRNTKDNVRTNAKLRLSLIPDITSDNIYFGGNNYLTFTDVYNKLLNLLSDNYVKYDNEGNVIDSIDEMITRLTKFSEKRPEFKVLVDLLASKDTPQHIKLELYQAFNTQRNQPISSEISYSKKMLHEIDDTYKNTQAGDVEVPVFTHSVKELSKSASRSASLRRNWNYSMFDKFVRDKENIESVKESISKITNRFKNISSHINNLSNKDNANLEGLNDKSISHYDNAKQSLISAFDYLFGYSLNPKAVDDLFKSGKSTIKTRVDEIFQRLSLDLSQNAEKNLKRAFDTQDSYVDLVETSTIIREIGDADSLYNKSDSDASVNSVAGSVFLNQNKSHMNTVVNMWRDNPNMLLQMYLNDPYSQSSEVIQYLLALDSAAVGDRSAIIKERLSEFNIQTLVDFYDDMGNSKEAMSASDIPQDLYTIDYINKILSNRNGATPVKTTVLADKASDMHIKMKYFVSGIKAYNTTTDEIIYNNNDKNNPILTLKNHFFAEINRMIMAEKVFQHAERTGDKSKLVQHYHYKAKPAVSGKLVRGNAFESQLFPELNPSFKGTYLTSELESLASSIRGLLFNNGAVNPIYGDKLTEDSFEQDAQGQRSTNLNELLDEFIRKTLDYKVRETKDILLDKGIIHETQQDLFSGNVEVKTSLIDSSLITNYYNKAFSSEKSMNMAIAGDFYINGVLRNIEFSKLFTGDFAYYKNMVDYKKRTPATNTDGVTPLLGKDQATFKYAVINSVEIQSVFHNKMIETWGKAVADKYNVINSADAQAWITPERWKSLLQGIKWNPTYDSLYEKMMSGKPETYTNEELHIMAQPLKGTYFWRDKFGRPLFFKYSQAVLTPLMVKGNQLEAVRDKMVAEGISELLTADAIKMGSPWATTMHNDNGDISDLNWNVQVADSRGWKLQQDLMPKTYHDTMVGSQIQKNIFAAIKHSMGDNFVDSDGKLVKGSDVAKKILNATKGKVDLGFNKLLKEFGIDENGIISNVDSLYNNLIDELKSRDSEPGIIEALEKRLPLDAIPQVKHKIDNLFSTMVTKRMVRIKTNGGSFIQMSNFGMSYNEATAKDSGVILHPMLGKMTDGHYKTFEPTFSDRDYSTNITDTDGNLVRVKRKVVNPAGIFISGSFISSFIPDYRKYSAEQLFGTYDENGDLVKHGIIDRKILESVIGYRIPNQGLASNDALQIVGILPETNGDTIVAYTGITTKTGSDFDIDKQYIMFPSYDARVDEVNKKALRSKLLSTFRGNTIKETIDNLRDVFKSLDSNDNIDLEEASKEIMNNSEGVNTTLDLLIETMLSSENKNTDYVKTIIKELGVTFDRLQYNDRKGTDGYFSNQLIEAYKSVLTNPDFISEITEPIDYKFLKEDIMDLTKPEFDYSNNSLYHMETLGDIDTYYSFKAGKMGVGIEANMMVDINRLGEMYIFNNVLPLDPSDRNSIDNTLELDQKKSRNLSEKDLKEYLEDRNATEDEELIEEITDVNIMTSMVAILNAFVDIAKDPYITRGNWNSLTTNLGNSMLRMGIHPLYVTAFIAQPIIRAKFNPEGMLTTNTDIETRKLLGETLKLVYTSKEMKEVIDSYVDEHTIALSEYLDSFNGKPTEEALKFAENLRKMNHFNETPEPQDFQMSLREMRNQIKDKDSFNLSDQMMILKYIDNISIVNQQIRENIRFSRMDTDGLGASISNMLIQKNRLAYINDSDINNKMHLQGFNTKLDNTVLSAYYTGLDNVYEIAKKNPQLFPDLTETAIGISNTISQVLSNENILDEDVYKAIKQEVFSKKMYDFLNFEKNELINLITSFPTEFTKFKNENKGKYSIIDELEVRLIKSENSLAKGLINISNRKRDSFFEAKLSNSWKQLLEDNPDFGEKLVKYSYATTGFKYSSTQFYSLIPVSYYINKDVTSFTNKYKNTYTDLMSFISSLAYGNPTVNKKLPYVAKPFFVETNGNTKEGYMKIKEPVKTPDQIARVIDKYGNRMLRTDNLIYMTGNSFRYVDNQPVMDMIPIGTNLININGKMVTNYEAPLFFDNSVEFKESFSNLLNRKFKKAGILTTSSENTVADIQTPLIDKSDKLNVLSKYKGLLEAKLGIEGASQFKQEVLGDNTITYEELEEQINCL